jgi:hypothetical protein
MTGGKIPPHGKQAHGPEVEELLDVIRQLLDFSRAGTPECDAGEEEAYDRASGLLSRHSPARLQRP